VTNMATRLIRILFAVLLLSSGCLMAQQTGQTPTGQPVPVSAPRITVSTSTQGYVQSGTGPNVFTGPTTDNVLKVNTSVLAGSGMQHIRGAVGCTTAAAAGATCTSAAQTWAVAFPDTNYTLSCTLDGITSGVPAIVTVGRSAGSFTISIAALTAVAATANYDCVALHD
jgi:hypothetical protein